MYLQVQQTLRHFGYPAVSKSGVYRFREWILKKRQTLIHWYLDNDHDTYTLEI